MRLHKYPVMAMPLVVAVLAALLASCAGAPAAKPAVPPQKPQTATAVPVPPPNPKIAAVESAGTLLASGNAAAAADSLGKLAAANPTDLEIKRLQASALASAGKLPDARAILDGILAEHPRDVDTLTMAAEVARFQNDNPGRKAYLDVAIATAPDRASVQVSWGQYWLDQHAWPNAQAAFTKASEINRSSPDAFKGLGQALYRLGKYDDAEKALDTALALDPSDAYTWSDRSKVRYQLGMYADSEADLGEAIAKAPNASWPYIDRARFRIDTKRFAEAEADLDEAIKAEPDYFLPYLYRAAIFVKVGKDVEALADYDMVVKLNPEYWYAYESAGLCAFRLARWQDAGLRFEKAFASAPTRADYAVLGAIALLRAGKLTEGREFAGRAAARLDRDAEHSRWTILRLLQDMNDLTTDLEIGQQNEQKLDIHAEMLFSLAEYWIIRGKPDLGAKYLQLAHDMNRQGAIQYSLIVAELARSGTQATR